VAEIRAKRIAVKMLDGRVRVSTEACRAFLASLPDEYLDGEPVRHDAPPSPPRPKTAKACQPRYFLLTANLKPDASNATPNTETCARPS
jgi:hypothetical protein